MAKKYDHKKEQAKTYKWWQTNKENIRLRIINNFNLPNKVDRKEGKGIMCGQTNDELNKLCEFHEIDKDFLMSYKGQQSKTKIIMIAYCIRNTLLSIEYSLSKFVLFIYIPQI